MAVMVALGDDPTANIGTLLDEALGHLETGLDLDLDPSSARLSDRQRRSHRILGPPGNFTQGADGRETLSSADSGRHRTVA